MSDYQIYPSHLAGSIRLPPSKSHTLRAILFASLAAGQSVIKNPMQSPDADAMLNACKAFGAQIESKNGELLITGVAGHLHTPNEVIDAGNSGQVFRFVTALLALIDKPVVITGDKSIQSNRPIVPLLQALNELGVEAQSIKANGFAPVMIKGPVTRCEASCDGSDSQVVSALLIMMAIRLGTKTLYVENPGELPWIDVTLGWLRRFDVQYKNDGYQKYTVYGKEIIYRFDYDVPGDFSAAAYPLVAAVITDSAVTITNVDMQDSQGDKELIFALQKMGANIDVYDTEIKVCSGAKLRGTTINVNRFIDAITILAVAACFAEGETVLTGAAIARKKECDRLYAITNELKKMGADISETTDGLIIRQSTLSGATLKTYHDHRMVMSLSVAAIAAKGHSIIEDVDCVRKSYANFFTDMQKLGMQCQVVETQMR